MTNIIQVRNEEMDLANLTSNPKFEGMTEEYLREIIEGLKDEEGEEIAYNFVSLLRDFAGGDASSSLDNMGYDDLLDDEDLQDLFGEDDNLTSTSQYERDPARNAKLTQALTKGLPKGTGSGVLFDSVLGQIVAETWDDENERPERVPVHILLWHRSQVFFEKGSNRPTCSSKDGVINRFGGICKGCPHVISTQKGKAADCTKQMNMLAITEDFGHMFKYSFSKTNLMDGMKLAKQFNARHEAHLAHSSINAKQEKGEMGEWHKLDGSIGSMKAEGARKKALNLFRDAYVAYFKRAKKDLLSRYKELKESGVKLIGPPKGSGGFGGGNGLPQLGAGPDNSSLEESSVDLSQIGDE